MNVALTDHLVCPRCGPPFGLILLAHEVRDRRVSAGELGCPNCRDRFPVDGGFSDLRAPPRTPPADHDPTPDEALPEDSMRIAAMLGVAEGPGIFVFVGSPVASAAGVAALVSGIEVVALGWDSRVHLGQAGVSPMVARPLLPFHDRTVRGAAMSEDQLETWLPQVRRVLQPRARLAVVEASEGAAQDLGESGFEVILEEGGNLVVQAP